MLSSLEQHAFRSLSLAHSLSFSRPRPLSLFLSLSFSRPLSLALSLSRSLAGVLVHANLQPTSSCIAVMGDTLHYTALRCAALHSARARYFKQAETLSPKCLPKTKSCGQTGLRALLIISTPKTCSWGATPRRRPKIAVVNQAL